MENEPIWYGYATYDDDGFVNGVREDSPQNVKDAYKAYKDNNNRINERDELIPR